MVKKANPVQELDESPLRQLQHNIERRIAVLNRGSSLVGAHGRNISASLAHERLERLFTRTFRPSGSEDSASFTWGQTLKISRAL